MEKYGDIPDNIEALALFSNFDRPVLDLSGKFRTDDDGDIVFNFGPKFGMKAKYNIDTLEWMLSKDFPADTCSVCYKLMEEFGGNNFDDNNYIFGAKAHSSRSVGGMQATCSVNRTTKLILF